MKPKSKKLLLHHRIRIFAALLALLLLALAAFFAWKHYRLGG